MSTRVRSWPRAARLLGAAAALAVVCLCVGRCAADTNTTPMAELSLTDQDRILVLAPHPDDEVLGCGGVLQHALARKIPVRVVFLTYGDNNQWSFLVYRKHPVFVPGAVLVMGLTRHDEALAAAKALGVDPSALTFLGYPDFGTLNIWYAHWDDAPPYRSMLTRVRAVAYPNAFRPGAPHKGEEILQDLTQIMRDFRPTKVFVSHPADHNPDHRALYLFTRVCLWDLANELQPQLLPYLVHYQGWPVPRGYHPDKALVPPPTLDADIWSVCPLSSADVAHKHEAIRQHRTQFEYGPQYLESFMRANELFGDMPVLLYPPPAQAAEPGTIQETYAATAAPEELTDEERAAFFTVESRYVRIDGTNLTVRIKLSKPLAEAATASVYVFGYRADRPFATMPKIHVQIGELAERLLDQSRELPREGLVVKRSTREISVQVPLALLGQPQKILTGARTYIGDIPLDWVAWRIIELRSAAEETRPAP